MVQRLHRSVEPRKEQPGRQSEVVEDDQNRAEEWIHGGKQSGLSGQEGRSRLIATQFFVCSDVLSRACTRPSGCRGSSRQPITFPKRSPVIIPRSTSSQSLGAAWTPFNPYHDPSGSRTSCSQPFISRGSAGNQRLGLTAASWATTRRASEITAGTPLSRPLPIIMLRLIRATLPLVKSHIVASLFKPCQARQPSHPLRPVSKALLHIPHRKVEPFPLIRAIDPTRRQHLI